MEAFKDIHPTSVTFVFDPMPPVPIILCYPVCVFCFFHWIRVYLYLLPFGWNRGLYFTVMTHSGHMPYDYVGRADLPACLGRGDKQAWSVDWLSWFN